MIKPKGCFKLFVMSFVIVPFTCERFQRDFRYFFSSARQRHFAGDGMSFFGEGRPEQLEAAKNAITSPRLQVKLFNIIDNQDVFFGPQVLSHWGLKNQGCLERVFYDVMSYT